MKCLRKPRVRLEKPESMQDIPSSDSDKGSDKNDTYEGLSRASIYIGEGPFLYLQIIKTFFVLFFILSIINIPVFFLYSGISDPNDLSSFTLTTIFEKFQLGNIGKIKKVCDYSWINHEMAST
jgi:hypothetical protein